MGRKVYAINPEGAGAYPEINHSFDLWSILKDNIYLFDNARRIAVMGLKDDMKGDNSWVYDDAKRWVTRILILLVLLEGRVTPKRFWQVINGMDADNDCLQAWERSAKNLPYDIQGALIEIYRTKNEAEKTYSAVMGKIKSDFDWLSSPHIAESISGDNDILPLLNDPNEKTGIYCALKSGSGEIMQGFVSMVVGIAMLHSVRNITGTKPTFYLEEAATCGKASFIRSAVSEFRKYFHTVLVYQSPGQPVNIFGKAGAQELMESCGQHIYLGGGIRDFDSAKKLSDTIGKTTILLDDPMAQSDRKFKAQKTWRDSLIKGGDVMEAAERYEHERQQSREGRYIQRDAIDPAEVMRLTNEVVILSPGTGAPPLVANKLPNYWENPAMAGRYAPDPLFPPMDRVVTKNKFMGSRTRKVIREAVPDHLADWPNHSNGEIIYIDGFKTF